MILRYTYRVGIVLYIYLLLLWDLLTWKILLWTCVISLVGFILAYIMRRTKDESSRAVLWLGGDNIPRNWKDITNGIATGLTSWDYFLYPILGWIYRSIYHYFATRKPPKWL